MAEEKLLKQRADYKLLKTKHQTANNGDIYETDYFTTMRGDGMMGEQMDIYSDSNFKFSVNTTPNTKRVHNGGNWFGNDNGEEWTLETVPACSVTPETKIEKKSDYNSLQDFAYYGSALELVKASMNDIVMNFPAGMYFSGVSENKFFVKDTSENYDRFTGSTGCSPVTFGLRRNDVNIKLEKPLKNTTLLGANNSQYHNEYFTIRSLSDNNEITFKVGRDLDTYVYKVSYTIDDVNWVTYDRIYSQGITVKVTLNSGEIVRWKCDAFRLSGEQDGTYCNFKSTGEFEVEGNIMSLLYDDNFSDKYSFYPGTDRNFFFLFYGSKVVNAENLVLPVTALTDGCYSSMFGACMSLTTVPELPATTMADGCYSHMFASCRSLTTVPELPATTLANRCYFAMFNGCSSLTTVPDLPATTMEVDCYGQMFSNCTSLTTVPDSLLPATTLASSCYTSMFSECTSLTGVPELPATTLADNCYRSMFHSCTSLTTAPELPATTLAYYCYHGMFHSCTSLATTPELPATTLADNCYSSMFAGCTSLTTAPELPATTLADDCYNQMFSACTSLATGIILPATALTENCYSNMFNGCTSLSSITCSAQTFGTNSTKEWLSGVSSDGVFYTPDETVWSGLTGVDGIPETWCINTYPCTPPEISIAPTSLTVCHSDRMPKTLQITSNTGWTASALTNEVFIIPPTTGSGDSSITFEVITALTAPAVIEVTADSGETKRLTIYQISEPTFNVSQTAFTHTGGTMLVTISCSGSSNWTFNGGGYAQAPSTTGVGPTSFTATVAANTEYTAKTFNVSVQITDNTVSSGSCTWTDSKTCTLDADSFIQVSPTGFSLCYNDSAEQRITVTSNSGWTATANNNAIRFSSNTGIGDGLVRFTVDGQLSSPATITVKLDDKQTGETITVTKPVQPTCSVPNRISHTGGTLPITINYGDTFEYIVSSSSDKVSPQTITGNGSGSVTLNPTVSANETYQDVQFTLTISLTSQTTCSWLTSVTVTLEAKPEVPYIMVNPSEFKLWYKDTTAHTFSIGSNSGWTVSSNSNQITLSPTAGTGNHQISFTVNGTLSSPAVITAKLNGEQTGETITVKKPDGPTYSVPDKIQFTGGTLPITINYGNDFNYSVTSSSNKVSPQITTGSGSTYVSVGPTVSANETNQEIQIPLTIALTAQTTQGASVWTTAVTVPLEAKPEDAYITVSPTNFELWYNDTTAHTFNIQSNSGWTVSSDNNQVVFLSNTAGTESAQISFRVDGTLDSPATITAKLNGEQTGETITVKKAAAPSYNFSTTSLPYTGGTIDITINYGGNFQYSVSDGSDMNPQVLNGNAVNTITVSPTILANDTTSDKQVTINLEVSSGSSTWTDSVNITVAAMPVIQVSENNFVICYDDETAHGFDITSNSAWTIVSSDKITFSRTTGNGNSAITFTLNDGFVSPEDVTVRLVDGTGVTISIKKLFEPSCIPERTGFTSNGGMVGIVINAPSGSTYRVSSNPINRIDGEVTGTINQDETVTAIPNIMPNTSTDPIDFDIIVAVTADTGCTWAETIQCVISGIGKTLDVTPAAYNLCFDDTEAKYLDVQSNSSWSVSSSNPDKISLSKTGGTGDDSISFSLLSNLTNPETITFMVSDGSITKTVAVNQTAKPGCSYGSTTFQSGGGEFILTLSSQVGLSYRINSSPTGKIETEISGRTTSSSTLISVNVLPNTVYMDDYFTLKVWVTAGTCTFESGIPCTVLARHDVPTLEVNPDNFSLCYNGPVQNSFEVRSNSTWNVTSTPNVHYSPASGVGSGTVMFTVDEGTVTYNTDITVIVDENTSKRIPIKIAKKPVLTVSPSLFPSTGGDIEIVVSAESSTNWILSGPYEEIGSGYARIVRHVPQNDTPYPKTETIKLTDTLCNWSTSMTFTVKGDNSSYSGTYMYEVYNPFDIDILSEDSTIDNVKNPLRYLGLSIEDYVVNGYDESGLTRSDWKPIIYDLPACDINSYEDGVFLGEACIRGINVFVFYQSGEYHYLTNDSSYGDVEYIAPKKSIIEQEFSKFDEFEHVLLDRSSNPVYTSYFDTPYETDYGYSYNRESYTWPSVGDYLPLISGPVFSVYLSRLIDLATFYDEYWSDNIWRSMTHEAIKNLDWTFVRDNGDTVEDMSVIDSSKVQMITRLWGRNSDDLKSYIDNIKNTSKVSYDQKNNTPDYFLSDEVEISGIDPITLGLATDNLYRTDNLDYSGLTTGFTASDANSELFRRLRINHRYLSSVKGTREGVEAMLELLGMNGGYKIDEFVTVANNFPNADDIVNCNRSRDSVIEKLADSIPIDDFEGLPVIRVSYSDDSSTDYIAPWYDINNQYDNGLYYQMFGGWGLRKEKEVYFAGEVRKIKSIIGKFGIYDETVQRLKYAANTNDLREIPISGLKPNDMCYVFSVDDSEEEDELIKQLVHYYVWKQNLSGQYTWQPIINDGEIDQIDVNRAIYLSTIIDTTVGNNQHCGYGQYDDGNEYIDRFDSLFGYLCDDFKSNPNVWTAAKYQKFNINREAYLDNEKCWFFINDNLINSADSSVTSFVTENGSGDSQLVVYDTDLPEQISGNPYTLHSAEYSGFTHLEESNSLSVVNLKNMKLVFYYPNVSGADEKFYKDYVKYVDEVVMHYVKQMIPSTTIFMYTFEKNPDESYQGDVPESDEWGKVKNIITINVG